jgi:hypothetical protein
MFCLWGVWNNSSNNNNNKKKLITKNHVRVLIDSDEFNNSNINVLYIDVRVVENVRCIGARKKKKNVMIEKNKIKIIHTYIYIYEVYKLVFSRAYLRTIYVNRERERGRDCIRSVGWKTCLHIKRQLSLIYTADWRATVSNGS